MDEITGTISSALNFSLGGWKAEFGVNGLFVIFGCFTFNPLRPNRQLILSYAFSAFHLVIF